MNLKGCLAVLLLVVSALAGSQTIVAQIAPSASAADLAAKYGIVLVDQTVGAPFVQFGSDSSDQLDQARVLLEQDPEVVWVEDDYSLSTVDDQAKGQVLPVVGGRSKLYALNNHLLGQIHFNQRLALTQGRSVRIAVLDTGLSMNQPGLWKNVDSFMDALVPGGSALDQPTGCDSNGNGFPDEAVGHGTMVAGLIDQVAPKAHLVICRIADSDGGASAWTLIKGLAFGVTSGAEVANVSLASQYPIPAMENVIEWCVDHGMVIVAAAGNGGVNRAWYPARTEGVICVAGVDPLDVRASFSNFSTVCTSCAPATGVASAYWDGGLGTWSGTSFACPLVSGALSDCLRRTSRPMSPERLRRYLRSSGDNIDSLNPSIIGQLGTRLDIARLDVALHSPGRSP